ncbi:Alpha-ketoglutarate dehydrogenase subunit 4, mitochondrial [Diatrype stigma]|uniref:Alpha-ketoglutarate dehydrogenase subunit 4, mitochondrial n=1 Tax=Diatrype stigma TaxID=117547 RepID=A0AAN9U722_9PEZI
MYATRAMRQAAHAAERTPLIKFLGRRTIPSQVDHTPQPHPASPTGSLPQGFKGGNSHPSFSSYRDHAQQHGPLRKSIGTQTGAHLGPVQPPSGIAFDRNELPERFRRLPLTLAEIEAVETGGAALFG